MSAAATNTNSQKHHDNSPASTEALSLDHSNTQPLEPQSNLTETPAVQDITMPGSSATTDSALTTQGSLQTAHALSEEAEDSLLVQRQASHGDTSASSSSSSRLSKSDAHTSYNSSTIWEASSDDQEIVNSNATGMQLSFLGTASSVTCKTRYASAVHNYNLPTSAVLFVCVAALGFACCALPSRSDVDYRCCYL